MFAIAGRVRYSSSNARSITAQPGPQEHDRDRRPLTDRQREILEIIDQSMRERGYPPSVREIGEAVGLTSPSTVHTHLTTLSASASSGATRRSPGPSRSAGTRTPAPPLERRPVRHVPLVGDVAAGTDVLAQENVEELLPLPADFSGDGDLFMLRVRGDSMIDAGILDGDFVVARAQATADRGDIVVAGIPGEEATVKTYDRKGAQGHPRARQRPALADGVRRRRGHDLRQGRDRAAPPVAGDRRRCIDIGVESGENVPRASPRPARSRLVLAVLFGLEESPCTATPARPQRHRRRPRLRPPVGARGHRRPGGVGGGHRRRAITDRHRRLRHRHRPPRPRRTRSPASSTASATTRRPAAASTGAGTDDAGHGTHVAGIAAAAHRQRQGVAGVAPERLAARRQGPRQRVQSDDGDADATQGSPGHESDVAAGSPLGRRPRRRRHQPVARQRRPRPSSVPTASSPPPSTTPGARAPSLSLVAGNDLLLPAGASSTCPPSIVAATTERRRLGARTRTASATCAGPSPHPAARPTTAAPASRRRRNGILSTYVDATVGRDDFPPPHGPTYACVAGTSMAAPHVVGRLAVLRSTGLGAEAAVDRCWPPPTTSARPDATTRSARAAVNLARAVEGTADRRSPTGDAPRRPPSTAPARRDTEPSGDATGRRPRRATSSDPASIASPRWSTPPVARRARRVDDVPTAHLRADATPALPASPLGGAEPLPALPLSVAVLAARRALLCRPRLAHSGRPPGPPIPARPSRAVDEQSPRGSATCDSSDARSTRSSAVWASSGSPGPRLQAGIASGGEAGDVGPAELGPHRQSPAVRRAGRAAGGRGPGAAPSADVDDLEPCRRPRGPARAGPGRHASASAGVAVGREAVVEHDASPGRARRCRRRRPRPAPPAAPRGTRTRRAPARRLGTPRRRRAAARAGGSALRPIHGGRCGPGHRRASPRAHRALAAGLDDAAGGLAEDGGVAGEQVGAVARTAAGGRCARPRSPRRRRRRRSRRRRARRPSRRGRAGRRRRPSCRPRRAPTARRRRCGPARCRWPGRCRCGRRAAAAAAGRATVRATTLSPTRSTVEPRHGARAAARRGRESAASSTADRRDVDQLGRQRQQVGHSSIRRR